MGATNAALAMGMLFAAVAAGGFREHKGLEDMLFMLGFCLSIVGVVLGLAGYRDRSLLRWPSLCLSICMSLIWLGFVAAR